MARIRHLRRAPITEAIIDFRVQLPSGFEVESFQVLEEQPNPKYPKVQKRWSILGQFGFKEGEPIAAATEKSLHGYFVKTEDEKEIAQFRLDGFTYNRLAPYTSWKDIYPKAIGMWKRYVALASPTLITRLAARYINRLELPVPVELFTDTDYLRAPPVVPGDTPRAVRRFLTRLTIHEETGASAHITQSLEEPADPKFTTIILDIDAFKEVEIEIGDPKLEETWEILHDLKNMIFFDSITERTADLLE